jgi:beta-glucosidase/6-phospho-beta-glucosidase/beta-galactosidase
MGGYEGADHLNRHAVPLDMVQATGHLDRIDEDYRNAAALGLRSVRESIGWRLAEPQAGRYALRRCELIAQAARRHGVQVLWTLMHYGTPPDLSLLDDRLIPRFRDFARAVARVLGPWHDDAPVYNLVNEIGYVSWAVSETNLIHPYVGDPEGRGERTASCGYAVKRRLVRAVLAGIEAMREVDPRARFLHVEPVVHVVPPRGRPDLQGLADQVGSYQWQVWDMIAGRADAALGGHAEALDLVGVNHYHSGQWEVLTEKRLLWHEQDPRRRPLSHLLRDTWRRYGRPLMVAETSHIGIGRAEWLREVIAEVRQARRAGVPLSGVCLYPLIDRTDWDDVAHWHNSGLWDVTPRPTAQDPHPFARTLCAEYAEALAEGQALLPSPPREGVVAPAPPKGTNAVPHLTPSLHPGPGGSLQRLAPVA